MSDLQMLDEIIVLLKPPSFSWTEWEHCYSINERIFARLRAAYRGGEMIVITASLSKYFDGEII